MAIPQYHSLVNGEFGPVLVMYAVITNLLKYNRTILRWSMPVYDRIICWELTAIVKAHLLPNAVYKVEVSQLFQNLLE